MSDKALPSFPYGAVYYRRSNPPREDWERDYHAAAEDGMNTFATGSSGRPSRLPPASTTGRTMIGSSTWPWLTGSRRSSPR